MKRILAILFVVFVWASPASAAWSASPIAHATGFGTSTYSLGSMNTTGADFLVVVQQYNSAVTSSTIADTHTGCASPCNTWTKLTPQNEATEVGIVIWYAKNATGGTSTVITITCTVCLSAAEGSAWSGSDTSAPFDVENGFNSGTPSTTTQPGSITPGANNELVIWGGCIFQTTPSYSSATPTGTKIDEVADVSVYSGAAFYEVQTTATADNPTMTHANYKHAGVIASFKAASGGGGTTCPTLTLTGVGRCG